MRMRMDGQATFGRVAGDDLAGHTTDQGEQEHDGPDDVDLNRHAAGDAPQTYMGKVIELGLALKFVMM